MTPGALLETKFFAPRPPRGIVPRGRLCQRLDGILDAKLTLVAAPAGFGKSTLVGDWLASRAPGGPTVAWLSLDQSDDDPASFWTYLVAAFQAVLPGIDASALALLQHPQPPPIETVLTLLLNQLAGIRDDVVLVLDDYHLIDSQDIHAGMAYVIDHLTPRTHLVIASRIDPRCHCLACARGVNWWKSGPPICDSPLTRRQITSTTSWRST